MNEKDATAIANWVKAGGVLVMFANNHGNCEMQKFNILAQKFGVKFNDDDQMMVKGNDYAMGEHVIQPGNIIFKTAKNIFTKEVSSLTLKSPAKSVLKKDGLDYMSVTKYGKGTVVALGDPWIYNEYVDGRKLPLQYENYKGAVDFVKYLLQNVSVKK